MKILRSDRHRSAALFCGGLLLALMPISPLNAKLTSPEPWTTIGATGAVMLGTYTYQNGTAYLTSASGILRYNVVAVDGLLDTVGGLNPPHIQLTARFRDPDALSRVTVNLRRTRISDGFTANVAGVFLDSNTFPAGTQTRSTVCASTQIFDFVNYVYYVEVILTRAQGATSPSIDAIQIGWDDGGCIAPHQ
jgi:hypothetical protein